MTSFITNFTSLFVCFKILLLTIVCTILFLMRSIVILFNEFLFTNSTTGLINVCGVTFNCLCCECLPIFFILVVICWPTHKIEFIGKSENKVLLQ